MADEIQHFAVTIPAGTPPTALHVQSIAMPVRQIVSVDWQVPPGPSGHVGWFLSMGTVQVAPLPIGSYVIADNQSGTFYATSWPDSGAWELSGYNTGTHDHTIYLTFHVNVIMRSKPVTGLLRAIDIGFAPDLSRRGAPLGKVQL